MNAVERLIDGAKSVVAKTAALLQSKEPDVLEREAAQVFAEAEKVRAKRRAHGYVDDTYRELDREADVLEGKGRILQQRAADLREEQRKARIETERAEALINAEPNARAAIRAFAASTARHKKAVSEQDRLTKAVEKLRAEYKAVSDRLAATVAKAAEARVRSHVDGTGTAKQTREPHLRDEVEELRQAVALAEQQLTQATEIAGGATEDVEQRRRDFYRARAVLAEVRFKEHEEEFFPLAADLLAAVELADLGPNERPSQWAPGTVTIDPPIEVLEAAFESIKSELVPQ